MLDQLVVVRYFIICQYHNAYDYKRQCLKKSRQSFATELWIEHVNSITIE